MRPKEVSDAFRKIIDAGYPGAARVIEQHLTSLESKLPPDPEEVWEKYVGDDGKALLKIRGSNELTHYYLLPEKYIEAILRNRELVLRGIDWEKFDHDFWLWWMKRDSIIQDAPKTIRSLIEDQIKGE